MTRRTFTPVKPRAAGTPKACLGDLFAQAGGVQRVMVRLGLGQSQVYAYADPQSPEEISFARVAALTDAQCTAAAEYLSALAGGGFLPGPAADGADWGALTAEAMREHGEAMACLVAQLADGTFTAAEARASLPEVDDAVQALLALRARVLATLDRPES
ncbi:MAG: phage regulatory CII family protein [Reyranellaceae bacterium]